MAAQKTGRRIAEEACVRLDRSVALPDPWRPIDRRALTSAGAIFHMRAGDGLQMVALPKGWLLYPRNGEAQSRIVDGRRRIRGLVWDGLDLQGRMPGCVEMCGRFRVETDPYIGDGDDDRAYASVLDAGAIIYREGPVSRLLPRRRFTDEISIAEHMAYVWLDVRYPDHRSLTAYWDA